MNIFVGATALTLSLSYILKKVPNRSNFKSVYVIPLICLLVTKYVVGDFDLGYVWTLSDVFFVLYVLTVSYLVIKL